VLALIVIPASRSRSMAVEDLVGPLALGDRPGPLDEPIRQRRLPWSMWAMIEKLRMFSRPWDFGDLGSRAVRARGLALLSSIRPVQPSGCATRARKNSTVAARPSAIPRTGSSRGLFPQGRDRARYDAAPLASPGRDLPGPPIPSGPGFRQRACSRRSPTRCRRSEPRSSPLPAQARSRAPRPRRKRNRGSAGRPVDDRCSPPEKLERKELRRHPLRVRSWRGP